jgi:hypothetical protein
VCRRNQSRNSAAAKTPIVPDANPFITPTTAHPCTLAPRNHKSPAFQTTPARQIGTCALNRQCRTQGECWLQRPGFCRILVVPKNISFDRPPWHWRNE